jgi:hypothetical protein
MSSSIPYNKSSLLQLHKENLNIISNYLCRNSLPIPDSFGVCFQHPNNLHDFGQEICQTIHINHPLERLKRVLKCFDLLLLPSDKTKILVIIPEDKVLKEMHLHLSDNTTYKLLTPDEHQYYVNYQHNIINEAVVFYKKPQLMIENPSLRYIYFLPKTHKAITDWRSPLHPKMRPIVSDTNSITYNLAKHLLPYLQQIEKTFPTAVTSSLVVSLNVCKLNGSSQITEHSKVITMDVESLFTKIPQEKLLQIVNHYISNIFPPSSDTKDKFMHFLQSIINYNTFQVNTMFYLQRIGLPMGGPLSGTLANIYLGHMEKELSSLPDLQLYNRYMDDILVICTLNANDLEQFINKLQVTYDLKITASYNNTSVNFLDMTIAISQRHKCLKIRPYSKKHFIYPLPTSNSYRIDVNILKSQVLRVWRICTDDMSFSKLTGEYLSYLERRPYYSKIRKAIFSFLRPVKLSTHTWTTYIPICSMCSEILNSLAISINKIIPIESGFLAIKNPVNCHSKWIYILVENDSIYNMINVPSLHYYLIQNNTREISILPIGKLNAHKVQSVLKKFPIIQHYNKENILKKKITFACRINSIFRNPSYVYGIKSIRKRMPKLHSTFNGYKKISRKLCQ